MIAAILRAQLLSMRLGASRGAIFSLITGVIWYGFWCAISSAVYLQAAHTDAADLRVMLPTSLLLICLYWQVVPIISASMGSALDMRKLLVYPVPHHKLFIVEVLLRFTTGFEMILLLAGGVAGLLRNPEAGGWHAAPRLFGPVLLYVLFNLLLASGMRSFLERLLARRRLREILVLLLVLGVTVPRLLILTGVRPAALGRLEVLIHSSALPWVAAAQIVLGDSGLMALLTLSGWTLLAAWFGRMQFERNLRYDAVAAQATPSGPSRGAQRWNERYYRLPSLLFPDPLAAIVEKELRSLSRTPRFRMIFVMGFSFGPLAWLPLVLGRQAAQHGVLAQNFLVVVCVYALTLLGQVTYWNSFGFDRSAAQIYFAAPPPISQILLGKNIASLFFIYLEALILTIITTALRVDTGPGKVIEMAVVVSVSSLYMMAFGNISSVRYPRGLAPERVSQGGASSRFQALVFILYPLALLPVGLAYLARYAFDSQTVFAAVLALAAVIAAVLYRIGMESAVATAGRYRERILMELSRGEGPVVSG